jgi:hypothetical protein
MTDEPGPVPPSREQLEEDAAAALVALRDAIGDRPVEVATTGELAALLARVPADTALLVDEHVRIDPDLDEGTTESRHAVQATAVSAFADEPVVAVDEHGGRDVYSRRIAGLMLGSVMVAQGEPAPAQTVAYGASERITEALYTGDGAGMLDAFVELVRDVAGRLDGIDDASLLEWLTDKDLVGQLEVEGDRLRQSAARLAVLRDRVASDLAAQPPPSPGEGDNGGQQ